MKKLLIFILFIYNVTELALAQEQPTKMQLADRLFERYEYEHSLRLYLQLASKKTNDVQLIERIADCYRFTGRYPKAEQWYAKALNYNNASTTDIYYYAESLLRNQKLQQARKQYEVYFTASYNPDLKRLKLATCDSAEKWMSKPLDFRLNNEVKLNTMYADWGLTFYTKNTFVFTSDRLPAGTQPGKSLDPRTGNSFFKLYVAGTDSVSLLPIDVQGQSIFNGAYHAGPIAFNATCDTAYITVTTTVPSQQLPVEKSGHQHLYTRRLQLIIATRLSGKWRDFKSFAYNNVLAYSTGHAALSKNGQVLYFVSDRPGGEGKTDIWYTVKQADGSWAAPINCGKTINTSADEAFPTIISDSLLSFASTGLPGMGGYDLFMAKGNQSSWSTPINLQYPVNSTNDDFYLTTPDKLKSGYFSSNRLSGQGSDDIYSFTNSSSINILDNKSNIPFTKQDVESSVKLPLLTVIYYDLDKATIRLDAAVELDQLITTLNQHPAVHIQLSSYTDSRATADYNMVLSQRRSAAVFNYLVAHGINASRLVLKNFGETHLVNQCIDDVICTEAEQQLNRRTEISLIKEE